MKLENSSKDLCEIADHQSLVKWPSCLRLSLKKSIKYVCMYVFNANLLLISDTKRTSQIT